MSGKKSQNDSLCVSPYVLFEPSVNSPRCSEALGHVTGFVFQVEHYLVRDRLVKLVSVDVRAEDIPRRRLVFSEERSACEADKDRVLQPSFHLLVHFAALGAVTFIHKDVEAPMDRRRRSLEVR